MKDNKPMTNSYWSCESLPCLITVCDSGLGLLVWGVGGRRAITMGVWSDPVEGRDDPSPGRNAENICGLAKARSMVPGLWVPEKGNRV